MKRLAVLALLFASYVFGADVFITAHGKKSYHTHRDCMSLKRAKTVLTADETTAQAHGLTICGICAHRHAKTAGGNNTAWAKEVTTK